MLSYLKDNDWVSDLTAGVDEVLGSTSWLEVEVNLTKKGFENYEKVIEATFQYMNKIREHGPQQWVFDEIKQQGDISFKFAEKGDISETCCRTARKMPKFNEKNID